MELPNLSQTAFVLLLILLVATTGLSGYLGWKYAKAQVSIANLKGDMRELGHASSRMVEIVRKRDSLMQPLVEKSKLLYEKYKKDIDTTYISDMPTLIRELTDASETR